MGVMTDATPARALAVLPFAHTSAEKGKEYFTEGLTDELTNALSTVPRLRVVARTSVAAMRPRALDARVLARRLGADVMLEGGVQIAGDRARIVVQLVDAQTGFQLWSGRYDRQMRDVLAVQDEITSTIVRALQLELTNSPVVQASRTRPPHPGAHDLYLRGRYVAERRGEANFRTAISNFEQAIVLDSSFALAWAGLATTRVSLADRAIDSRAMYEGARTAAERAVWLDSTLAEPHVALGRVHFYAWEWRRAEWELRRAVDLNGNDADARHWYAHILMVLGRTGEANAQQARMLALDPYGPQAAFHPCWQFYELRHFDRALDACRRALEVHPNQPEAHTKLGFVFWGLRMYDSAVVTFGREREITPNVPTATANLAMALASAGRVDSARAELRGLLQSTSPERIPPLDVACAYIALGDRRGALEILERAAAGRRKDLAFGRGHRDLVHAKYEPCLDPIRGTEAFARLIRALGLP
jgi:serine/threonine-protein kinase